MFPYLRQQCSVACRTVHQVHGDLPFSWIKAKNMTVAFAPAVVLVMVGIKPKSPYIPQLWLMPTYSLHHFNQHLAIFSRLLVEGSKVVFDGALVVSSDVVHTPIVPRYRRPLLVDPRMK